MSGEPTSYILRIQRDELERQLFCRREFYVNLNRDWAPGTRVLFVKKDAFAGSGVIDRFIPADGLDEGEKKMCSENNWYGKILFEKLARLLPAVPVQDTTVAGQNPLALHGASLSSSEAMEIEESAPARIIS